MSSGQGTPTLLVFTLGPSREGARRHLLPPRLAGEETAFHRACLDSALAAGRAAGCRLVVSSPDRLDLPPGVLGLQQRGRGFGERLRGALRAAAASGTGPLLVVGTDTPGLRPGHLRTALRRLRKDPEAVVAGPSPDGGFYLLAAARTPDRALARVRWCRRDTLRSLLSGLRAAGRPTSLLEPVADLDRAADLERWLARRSAAMPLWRGLRRALLATLSAWRRPSAPTILGRALGGPAPLPAGRAPPG